MKVRTNPALINLFISQHVKEASNYQESLWYSGSELYSYRSLLARIDTTKNVLLINEYIRNYSNTTAKHTSTLVGYAKRASYKILIIPLSESSEEILKFYTDTILELLNKYKRARKNKDFYKIRIKDFIRDVEYYANYSGIKDYKVDTALMQELFKLCIL